MFLPSVLISADILGHHIVYWALSRILTGSGVHHACALASPVSDCVITMRHPSVTRLSQSRPGFKIGVTRRWYACDVMKLHLGSHVILLFFFARQSEALTHLLTILLL